MEGKEVRFGIANSSLFTVPVGVPDASVFEVAASDVATDLGSPMSAGFVLLGAFVAVTGLVAVDSVIEAMQQLVPSYRVQHVQANERAIRAGVAEVPALAAPAWAEGAEIG